jgi:OOP family OmpA-OmpF porin
MNHLTLTRLMAAALLSLGAVCSTSTAWAADPSFIDADSSADDIASALAGPLNASKAFKRTNLPDPATNRCEATASAPGSSNKNFEIVQVPYVEDNNAQHVNMGAQFATGSDELSASDKRMLNNVVTALNSEQLVKFKFTVAGHTDRTGAANLNLELSCARAKSVRAYLVQRGVDGARLTTYGFGSTRPLDKTGESPTNRRVEVRRGG